MPEIDVSYETPDWSSGIAPANEPERKTKRVYPTLCIPGNEALARALKAGQEFTATVKLRVSEVMIRERADGKTSSLSYPEDGVRVELEVQSLSPNGITIKEGSGEKDGAEAMKEYFGKKSKPDDDGDED